MKRIEELPEEYQGVVRGMTALMGLAMAYRERYGDESLEVIKSFGEKMGTKMGNELKQKGGIKGSGLEDMRKMMDLFTEAFGTKAKYETEANKLRIIREVPSLCPMIFVSKAINVPLRTVCENLAFPQLRALMKTVNPNVKHTSIELSEQRCVDGLEI
ncbi:MAG: hypothetical protein AVW06_02370 [Hadesarchaea archaeon DG-33-1]|nr:MAG: hypothetical protein AVW06_02370 [Hadesarchaea archaeon DG-33-1]